MNINAMSSILTSAKYELSLNFEGVSVPLLSKCLYPNLHDHRIPRMHYECQNYWVFKVLLHLKVYNKDTSAAISCYRYIILESESMELQY